MRLMSIRRIICLILLNLLHERWFALWGRIGRREGVLEEMNGQS